GARHYADCLSRPPLSRPPAAAGGTCDDALGAPDPARRGGNMKTDRTLTRLRAANPVAEVATVDNDALFDRIAALPTETARPRPRRNRRVLVLVAAPFVAAVAASTAYALTHWVFPDVVHAPVSRAEYKRAQR